MVDRELLRQNPELFKESVSRRGLNPRVIDEFIKADNLWRNLLKSVEKFRSQKNALSRGGKPSIGDLKKAKTITKKLGDLEAKLSASEDRIRQTWLELPNLADETVPPGGDENNLILEHVGKPRLKEGQPHHELMTKLGWIDLKTAAKFSGSRFRYLLGKAAIAHLKIINTAVELAIKNGFTPVIPPVLTRAETLEKAGFFPNAKDDVFKLEDENLYLTGTSEQTLLSLSADKVFNETELPLRLVGFSSCFRREVGSYGKDVEGMFRQHQFDKVEMVVITTPEQSSEEHESLLSIEKKMINELDLPFQVVLTAAGDLNSAANKKIDLETWFPSQGRYRETHSASNCTDYQARRFNIKYRAPNGQVQFAHTLNATLATERLLLAVIENNQTKDGRVELPRSLQS